MFAVAKIWIDWNDDSTHDGVVAVFDSEDAAKAWAQTYIGDNRDVAIRECDKVWWWVGPIEFNPEGTIKELEECY